LYIPSICYNNFNIDSVEVYGDLIIY